MNLIVTIMPVIVGILLVSVIGYVMFKFYKK